MTALLIVIHVLICIGLVIVILLQSGKGGGLAGAFGGSGGSVGAIFGGRGAATILNKLTTGLAIAFMLSCLGQGFLQPQRGKVRSVLQEEAKKKASMSQSSALPTTPQQTETDEGFELPPAPPEGEEGD